MTNIVLLSTSIVTNHSGFLHFNVVDATNNATQYYPTYADTNYIRVMTFGYVTGTNQHPLFAKVTILKSLNQPDSDDNLGIIR